MIEVEHLTRRYGSFTAVDDISFEACEGQVLGLLGPNGAGKSTTMRMVSGFLPPTSGRVRLCGHDLDRSPLQAHRILGYLPEGAPGYAEMTVHSFLRFMAKARGLKREAFWDGVDRAIERLQLESVLNIPLCRLSKGFKRRVGLAQAIVHQPGVLLLDEPTDGLDPNQKQQVRALIDAMARESTILVSTHLLEEVTALCNRVIIIAHGKLMVDTTPDALEKRSRYHGAVSFSAPGAGLAKRMLERLEEVSAVDVSAVDGRITVFPRAGCQILGPVQQLLQQQGLEVLELQLERGRLDEVFHMITTGPGIRL